MAGGSTDPARSRGPLPSGVREGDPLGPPLRLLLGASYGTWSEAPLDAWAAETVIEPW